MRTITRKLALAVAVAATTLAASTTAAQAMPDPYYVFIDPDTGRPCSEVVEHSNGALSGGCVVSMTTQEQPVFGAPPSCGYDFNVRFGSSQPGNYQELGKHSVYIDDIDPSGSSFFCVLNPGSNWGPSGTGADASWRAKIELDSGASMAGGHVIRTQANLFSTTYSETVVLHINNDLPMRVSNEIRARETDAQYGTRNFYNGKWTSSDGVRIYHLHPIDFNFNQ